MIPGVRIFAAPAAPAAPGVCLRVSPRAPTSLALAGSAEGLYRVSDPRLARFELYRGVNAAPDFTASAWQTFTALPFTTPALAAGSTYRLVLRRRNAWNILSQNTIETPFTVTTGGLAPATPSDPQTISLAAAAAGTVLAAASYAYDADGANQADTWLIYLRSDGTSPDPTMDTPTTALMTKADGIARLSLPFGPYAEGQTIKAIVRTRRSGSPNTDSAGVAVYTAIATFVGPAAVAPADAFLGVAARQEQ